MWYHITPPEAAKYKHACLVGDTDAISDMFKKETRTFISDHLLHICLLNACEGGHPDIFHTIINKNLNHIQNLNNCDYDTIFQDTLFRYQSELHRAFRGGCVEIIDTLLHKLERSHCNTDYTIGLYGACETNRVDIFEKYLYLVHCGDLFINKCLQHACKSNTFGHKMISYLVSKGANNWKHCLVHACASGCLETVEYILNILNPEPDYCWDICLQNACSSGSLEMVEFILKKCYIYGEDIYGEDTWGEGGEGGDGKSTIDTQIKGECLRNACAKGNMDVINLLIKIGCDDWNKGLHGSCLHNYPNYKYDIMYNSKYDIKYDNKYGNIESAQVMIQKGATDLNWYLYMSCSAGLAELAKLLIKSGASDSVSVLNFNYCLYRACFCYDLELVQLLTSGKHTNWREGLMASCDANNSKIFTYMLEYGTFSPKYLNDMLKICANKNRVDMINILLLFLKNNNIPLQPLSLSSLEKVKDFRLHCMYVTSLGNCPKRSPKYLKYLCECESYILFVGCKLTKSAKQCSVKRLPAELFRLLMQY